MKTGKRWLAMLIKKLQQVDWDIWKDRNDALQDEKKGLNCQEEKENTLHQSKLGFEHFPSSVRALTRKTQSQVLAMKPDDRSAWLHSTESARTVVEQRPTLEERHQIQRQRQFMHQLVGITGGTVSTTTTAAPQRQRQQWEDP